MKELRFIKVKLCLNLLYPTKLLNLMQPKILSTKFLNWIKVKQNISYFEDIFIHYVAKISNTILKSYVDVHEEDRIFRRQT